MKWISRRRPSPAMIVASLALFVSLSGVSYGVATGSIDSREIKNNEVRSLDIRNNEIRTGDIRNNQVRGIDIRNSTIQGRDVGLNTLTGDDVAEDTLGRVPSAITADTATSAGGVDSLKIIPQTTVAEGAAPVTLASHGPFSLLATCAPNSGTETIARISVQTSEDNSAAAGSTLAWPDIDAGDPPQQLAAASTAGAANPGVEGSHIVASAPSGKAFAGVMSAYANASGAGTCKFHGFVTLQG